MPNIGELRVQVCKSTGKPVIMGYEGENGDPDSGNGHPYWLCLHNEDEVQDQIDAEAFNNGQLC